jgi:hypothetical protein
MGMGTSDGLPATAALFSDIRSLAFDPGGNLFVSLGDAHQVRRIEGATGRITRFAGTGSEGDSGDFGAASSALLSSPRGLSIDAARDVHFIDSGNGALRTIWTAVAEDSETASLSLVSGNAQSLTIGAQLGTSLAVRLRDAANANMPGGYTVTWEAVQDGSTFLVDTSKTNGSGIATALARASLKTGSHQFKASFRDIHGNHASGSPVTFTATATKPSAGTLFTLVNVDHTAGDPDLPAASTLARIPAPTGLARASNGTLYIGAGNQVFALSTEGVLTLVAGTGAAGFAGDDGPALAAKFSQAYSLALDESKSVLYVSDSGNDRIRAVDLSSGLISTYAGGGSAASPGYGDGGLATDASLSLSSGGDTSIGPDGALYFMDHNHDLLRRVDPTTGIINRLTVGTAADCNTSSIHLLGCGSSSTTCQMAWTASGELLIAGSFCSTSISNATVTIVRRASNGSLTYVAGKDTGVTTDGTTASNTRFDQIGGLAVLSNGDILVSVSSEHKIRRIASGTNLVTTVAGDGSYGYSGDYVPASQGVLNTPIAVLAIPGDGIVFGDSGNYAVRRIWGSGE